MLPGDSLHNIQHSVSEDRYAALLHHFNSEHQEALFQEIKVACNLQVRGPPGLVCAVNDVAVCAVCVLCVSCVCAVCVLCVCCVCAVCELCVCCVRAVCAVRLYHG